MTPFPPPTAGEEQLSAVFHFVNTGDNPVTLLDVRPDCDCAAAEWPRNAFQPGEGGAVTARFDLGESGGAQRKRLYVTASDHPDRPVALTVEIVSPKIARIEPRVLLWDETNPTAPKSFAVHLDDETSVQHLAVQTDSPDVVAALKHVDRNRYDIVLDVRPQHRPTAITVTLAIKTATTTAKRIATVVLR